jgi:hypothetical protein
MTSRFTDYKTIGCGRVFAKAISQLLRRWYSLSNFSSIFLYPVPLASSRHFLNNRLARIFSNKELYILGDLNCNNCNGAISHEISKDTIDKIYCTVSKLQWNLVETFFSHLWLCKIKTTGWYLRDSTIKSKQDCKIWLKSCFRGGKWNKMYYI